MVVRPTDAVKEVNRALSIVQDYLDEGARRVMAETGVSSTMAVRGDSVLRSFHRASRQLSKLKACLILQAELPLEYYWEQQHDVEVNEEGRKTHSILARAQKAAQDKYQTSMARLNSLTMTSTAHHGKALEIVECCQNATTAATSALNAVAGALAEFPVPEGEGGTSSERSRSLRDRRHSTTAGRGESGAEADRSIPAPLDLSEYSESGAVRAGLQRCNSARSFRSLRMSNGLRAGPLLPTDRRTRGGASLPKSTFATSAAGVQSTTLKSAEMRGGSRASGTPLVVRDGKIWREPVSSVSEERRAKSRMVTAAMNMASARPGDGRGQTREDRKNSKLSPEELRAASPRYRRLRHARGVSLHPHLVNSGSGSSRDVGNLEESRLVASRRVAETRLAAACSASNRSSRTAVRLSSPYEAPTGQSASDSWGTDRASRSAQSTPPNARQRLMDDDEAAHEADREEWEQAIMSNSALSVLLSASTSPSLPHENHVVQNRSLPQENRQERVIDTDMESVQPELYPRVLAPPLSVRGAREPSRGNAGARANVDRRNVLPYVDDDEATAQRIAQQEMEDQARDDAILALRLTALEEAGQERERRRARHRRRIQQPYILDPATAAAIASEGDVSEAIRMLQYQDIDENDFNVLLELDEEGGGVGAGLCGPSRSLTEEAIEAALRPSIVSGDRTSESCMICMSDYELNEEICILPCNHAFHSGCIRKWLPMRNICPADMQPVVSEKLQDGPADESNAQMN